jgi:hypothetical protein
VVDEDTRGALERSEQITPEYLLLIDAILILPETSLENENRRRIAVINTITAYCGVEEGPLSRRIQRGRPLKDESSPAIKAEEQDVTLSQAIRSIKTEKRPTKCFVYLGNLSLTLRERVVSYVTPGSLSRHFFKKHVKKLEDGAYIDCRICDIRIEHRINLLIHTERFHGTVSYGPAEKLVAQIS